MLWIYSDSEYVRLSVSQTSIRLSASTLSSSLFRATNEYRARYMVSLEDCCTAKGCRPPLSSSSFLHLSFSSSSFCFLSSSSLFLFASSSSSRLLLLSSSCAFSWAARRRACASLSSSSLCLALCSSRSLL